MNNCDSLVLWCSTISYREPLVYTLIVLVLEMKYAQFFITLETANILFVCFRSTVYNLSLYDLSENVEQVSIFYLNMRISVVD